jgi:hypothetical protein
MYYASPFPLQIRTLKCCRHLIQCNCTLQACLRHLHTHSPRCLPRPARPRPFLSTALLQCNFALKLIIIRCDNFLLWRLMRARTQGRKEWPGIIAVARGNFVVKHRDQFFTLRLLRVFTLRSPR